MITRRKIFFFWHSVSTGYTSINYMLNFYFFEFRALLSTNTQKSADGSYLSKKLFFQILNYLFKSFLAVMMNFKKMLWEKKISEFSLPFQPFLLKITLLNSLQLRKISFEKKMFILLADYSQNYKTILLSQFTKRPAKITFLPMGTEIFFEKDIVSKKNLGCRLKIQTKKKR